MNGLALLLAASALGVDYGWRPLQEGGLEYIIQIEPEVFASLAKGGDVLSEIHPQAQDVRRFRIRTGRARRQPVTTMASSVAWSSPRRRVSIQGLP
ncbi:MAG: hypothetical protein KY475_14730, partial [Planctomycetes bacterium]|nr:hypothetical protein [Planctomycetota bacterium]